MTVLPLQSTILYGPVRSRRLGRSLGINLMSCDYKVCSFNCVYCHYGWTDRLTLDVHKCVDDLPRSEEVVKAVEGALRSSVEIDFLTFSGNGEPTLYPGFAQLVDEIVGIRDMHRPELKIALLSNSTGLGDENVRRCVRKIDVPVFKLDVGTEGKFRAINRPAEGVEFEEILDYLASLEGICLQTALFEGTPSNVSEEDLTHYFGCVRQVKPAEVHIYSIDRPVPQSNIMRVSREKLDRIALLGEKETRVRIRAFSLRDS
ncbi:hypothetical protein AMJ40_05075 [candidate division TA06 bacterium DG_26]|uniref:Radical SAM core domain-containing protein n=1 Tax=candidate division TA06 bacterium DG_26 TaxID=1703771 RepID=A0A0S7WHK1_UNCT6|nr:MAG: hypothetical protein AMJ40_05075 [candidate division TA06 bacterium DG_26]